MDLRIKRTKNAVREAFLTLRRKKPIEKITVTELAALAGINKATFYLHYADIYALSDEIEDRLIGDILADIGGFGGFSSDPQSCTREVFRAFVERRGELSAIFSGSRYGLFSQKIERRIKQELFESAPAYSTHENDLVLTFCIQGIFHTLAQTDGGARPEDYALISALSSELIGRIKPADTTNLEENYGHHIS